MGFEGARKRFSCKGGRAVKRIWSVRGGGTENNYTFKCCNEGFCNSKKIARMPKITFLRF